MSAVRVTRDGLARLLPSSCEVVCSVRSLTDSSLRSGALDALLIDASTVNPNDPLPATVNVLGKLAVFGLNLDDGEAVVAWISAGARVCIESDASEAELIRGLYAAASGKVRCHPAFIDSVIRGAPRLADLRQGSPREHLLTKRESEIAELLSKGYSNKRIQHQLGIELSTVKNHVHSILVKLKISRRDDVPLLRPSQQSVVRQDRQLGIPDRR